MPFTRRRLTVSLVPLISMVPPKRTAPSIGVTATRASVRIEQSAGSSTGSRTVTL